MGRICCVSCCGAEAWESAASIARAFQIGKNESESLLNLQQKVDGPVVAALREAVRCRGMRGFLQHETIAKGVFNRAFTSGVGAYEVWAGHLTNRDDNELVHRLQSTSF